MSMFEYLRSSCSLLLSESLPGLTKKLHRQRQILFALEQLFNCYFISLWIWGSSLAFQSGMIWFQFFKVKISHNYWWWLLPLLRKNLVFCSPAIFFPRASCKRCNAGGTKVQAKHSTTNTFFSHSHNSYLKGTHGLYKVVMCNKFLYLQGRHGGRTRFSPFKKGEVCLINRKGWKLVLLPQLHSLS